MVKFISEYRKRLKAIIRAPFFVYRRFRSWLFSFVFGCTVIGTLYLLHWIVPEDYKYYNEIVVFLFILISVLLLFPAKDYIAKYLLKKKDYLSIIGKDVHHLDFIARQFTMNALINEIFPDLMDWLYVRTGQIIILEPERNYFLSHTYRDGEIHQDQPVRTTVFEESKKFLKESVGPVYYQDALLPSCVRDIMNKFHAKIMQPFVFRNRLLGLLILQDEPGNKYTKIALELFSGKAAVSIQNYILSMKVIDIHIFERELDTAKKIQKLLQIATIPTIPGFKIEQNEKERYPYIIEYYKGNNGKIFLIILCSPKPTGASGILMFGLLGYLFSYLNRAKSVSSYRIINYLKKERSLIRSKYRVDMMVAEINVQNNYMKYIIDGEEIHIALADNHNEKIEEDNKSGKINNLAKSVPLKLYYAGHEILKISENNNFETEAKGDVKREVKSKIRYLARSN